MMRTFCRVLTRQFPPLYKTVAGVVRVYPTNFAGACISSSCVNRRRTKDTSTKKLDVDKDDQDENESLFPVKGTLTRIDNSESSEYYSDESGSDEDSERRNIREVNLSFVRLPRRSHSARKELTACGKKILERDNMALVKQFENLKLLMDRGITPKKIFFTQLSDLLRLRQDFTGVKLYKIHRDDAPSRMQGKRNPPLFAIVEADVLTPKPLQAPAFDSLPATLICDQVSASNKILNIMSAAMACGCSRMLFTASNSLFDNFLFRNTGHIVDQLPIEFSQSWDMLSSRLSSDVSVFVIPLVKPDDATSRLPIVNLSEVDFWKKKEIVMICTFQLTEEAVEFCWSRNATVLAVREADDVFYRNLLMMGAVAFEVRNQWQTKSKTKTKTKVIKIV